MKAVQPGGTVSSLKRVPVYGSASPAGGEAKDALRTLLAARAPMLLESALDCESALQRAAEIPVGVIADWCVVFLCNDHERVRSVATAYQDAHLGAKIDESHRRFPMDASAPERVARVIRTGDAELYGRLSQPVRGRRDAYLALLGELGAVSALLVPLAARGRVLGAMVLVAQSSLRCQTERELALAGELADVTALALDNAARYAAARSAVEARDEFVAIVSHELKSPLATLDFSLQAMARFHDDERVRRTADVSRRHALKLGRLIDNLLDASRITAGRLTLERAPADLGELVRESAERLRGSCEREGCELSLSIEAGLHGLWDPLRIDQVVGNLLGNAIKYGKRAPVDVVVERIGGHARLTVRDRGIGIAERDLVRIFSRFERAGRRGESGGGAGLGLWIVRRTVEAMGGKIAVESRAGEGSAFTVDLPIERQGAERALPDARRSAARS